MSSSSKALSTDVGNLCRQSTFPGDAYISHCHESHLEHEDEEENEGEDEEEDVDFNPFLKESPSLEASSSLSSDVEILDADAANGKGKTGVGSAGNLSPIPSGQVQDYAVGDSEHGEEIVMPTAISSSGTCEKELEKISPTQFKKRKVGMICQYENQTFHRKEDASSSGMDIVNDLMVEDITHSKKSIIDINDEDAICKRTRARYSLASFTLDELETFLQETDDDDDLQNVNDEEEYRKFLAAVLQGGDGDSQIRQGNENADDEDENDADFEIEIEEALESDLDENTRVDTQEEPEAVGRRPETRQKRRQKSSFRQRNGLLGQGNRPLRPLLPNAPVLSFPVLLPETTSHFLSSGNDGFVNGFTPHQLGQLHCLVHEHVQLLIQVFSLCVLEPARQHIASQVRELISEMLHKREHVISQRRLPYPRFCFYPPYVHPSFLHGIPKSFTAELASESASSFDEKRDFSSVTNKGLPPGAISPSKENSGYNSNGQEGCFQNSENTLWVPFINGPIVSVLDVAPLTLVGKYIEDVSVAVREYHRQHVQAACDTHFKKEPLFPFHCSQSFAEANADVLRGNTLPTQKLLSYSSGDQPPKKTLAAALVERTKMQSIALVPKDIAKLAERFFPLFNPALFPHKPPPAPVANRVLFTDAEDELLAMGLMEYNTDWKAIQQRFLPCKSKHQIFVRQKNRSSSKAPENSIKAVRRMKSSPLTAEEIARIQEGLKVFKLDWMSVWKFVLPYRDPSLLPRQWRIATGTQKSYKSTADKKEKRRLYESNRRKSKPAALASWQTSYEKQNCQIDNADGQNNSGDDCIDNEDEAYVHEAFLADWRPGTTFSVPSWLPVTNHGERGQPCELRSQGGSCVMEQTSTSGSGECQPQIGLEFSAAFNYSQNLDTLSRFTNTRHYASAVEPNHPVSATSLRPSRSQFCSRPYRSRKTNGAHLVKLAPDLPPVNLPPSVRIMPQSAFKSYQGGASSKVPATEASTEKIVLPLPHFANSSSSHAIKSAENQRIPIEKRNVNQHQEESFFLGDKCFAGDKGESNLQMHPLLFQSSGDGNLPYYPLNGGDSRSSFNFFSRIQPQLNLSLLYNPHKANQSVNLFDKSSKSKETTSPAGDNEFHPLLQKTDDVNSDSVTAHSIARLSVNSEPLRDSCAQPENPFVAVPSELRVSSCPLAACTKSSSPNEKAKELDLDIHLSFLPRKEIPIGSRDVAENNPTMSNLGAFPCGTTMETQATTLNSSYQCSEYCQTASILNTMGNKLDSAAHALVVSSDNISLYDSGVNNEGEGGHSLPEIVMEQEELSDSDEEIGEYVEFECEEMDDSDGDEGSDAEEVMDMQKKEIPNAGREKFARASDFDDQQYEARTHGNNLQANVCQTPECDTSELSLKAQRNGNPSSPLCLNLNSCAPHSQTNAKAVVSTVMEGSGGKNCSASPPDDGSSTKPPSHRKRATDTPQQQEKHMELGSVTLTAALRGPRKSVYKSNASSSMGRPRKRESNVNTGAIVENEMG